MDSDDKGSQNRAVQHGPQNMKVFAAKTSNARCMGVPNL